MEEKIFSICRENGLTPEETDSVILITAGWDKLGARQMLSAEFSKFRPERQIEIVRAIVAVMREKERRRCFGN